MMEPDKDDEVIKDLATGDYKIWVGKDPSKSYNRFDTDLEGEPSTPCFWE